MPRLENVGTDEALALRDQACIDDARLAYAALREVHLGGQRFEELSAVPLDLRRVFLVLDTEGVEKFGASRNDLLKEAQAQLDAAAK
ncbi:hypothetical protein AWC20_01100 [Mycobacterium parmense]|nr:hypothetical protein AWC20_01100 [Mycobacterium parmense]